MTDFFIRPLNGDDAAAFKSLRLAAIADAPTAIWPTADEESMRTMEENQQKIRPSAGQVVFGAFAGEELVAIAGLRREALAQTAHKATVWGVFVQPQWRKAGIARQLLLRAQQHARETGVLQLQLSVNAANERAKNLYASLGFQAYGLEPRCMQVGDTFYDELHMWLRLDA
jgi:ribosomal protein S18 acetylase RimI-like enzyme